MIIEQIRHLSNIVYRLTSTGECDNGFASMMHNLYLLHNDFCIGLAIKLEISKEVRIVRIETQMENRYWSREVTTTWT
jgi:hypothetical protein